MNQSMAAVILAFFLVVCYPLQFFKKTHFCLINTRRHNGAKLPGQTDQKLTFLKRVEKFLTAQKTKKQFDKARRGLKTITMRKSCSEPCFPRCFGSSIFLWTQYPERISYQSIISRNSSAVTHCSVITPLFYRETTVLKRLV